jgi:excisionase family DNA binding protein
MTRLEAALAELVTALREEVASGAAPTPPERLLSVGEAAATLGISRTTAYGEIGAGRLRTIAVGRRRLVSSSAVADFIRGAEPS